MGSYGVLEQWSVEFRTLTDPFHKQRCFLSRLNDRSSRRLFPSFQDSLPTSINRFQVCTPAYPIFQNLVTQLPGCQSSTTSLLHYSGLFCQARLNPPSTTSVCPVTKSLPVIRPTIAAAISSAAATRFKGIAPAARAAASS